VNWKHWINVRAILVAVLFLLVGALGYELHKLRQANDQLRWESALRDHARDRSVVTPDVGVIQFLTNGYSVKLDTVESTAAGIILAGEFGNPKAITLSSVTLAFEVEKPMWKFRDAFLENEYGFLFSDTLDVGKAQAIVGDVPVGGTARFRVVIPNVKGDLKDYQVAVSLTGERYQYLR
jgi:hypothetical protein